MTTKKRPLYPGAEKLHAAAAARLRDEERSKRSAALTAQAEAELARVLAALDVSLDDDARLVAEMLWRAGYKAGMDFVRSVTDEAFSRVRAEA